MIKDIKIKDCYRFRDGKCKRERSCPVCGEFHGDDNCGFHQEQTAFVNNNKYWLRCSEFRQVVEELKNK